MTVDDPSSLELTFTTADHGPQTVTVSAVDDDVAEGSHLGTVTHAIKAGSAVEYLTADPGSVSVSITDNDSAGVSVVQSGGSTNVAEGGATDTYTWC